MIERPQSPCGKSATACKRRSVDECLACEDWKQYKAEMARYYESTKAGDTVAKAKFERKAQILHRMCRKTKRR